VAPEGCFQGCCKECRTANNGGRIHSFAKWGHVCMRS
jgi:hypothetical protein